MTQITLKELALAINQQIIQAFPSIPITTKDIKEGFSRPSFYVDFDSFRASKPGTRRTEKNNRVTIYFFPTDRYQYKLETLEVQEGLQAAFIDRLVIDESLSLITGETTGEVVDGVLQFEINLEYIEIENVDLADEVLPYMEELNYKG